MGKCAGANDELIASEDQHQRRNNKATVRLSCPSTSRRVRQKLPPRLRPQTLRKSYDRAIFGTAMAGHQKAASRVTQPLLRRSSPNYERRRPVYRECPQFVVLGARV
jgi:hypothetical protein